MHTPASIEMELRKLARSPKVEFRIADLTGHGATAMLFWKGEGVENDTVVLDPYLGGLIEGAIHELLHIHQKRATSALGRELEEALIEGFEDRIVRYVNRSNRRIKWWRNAISKRLP